MASMGKRMPRNSGRTIGRLMHYLNEDKPKMMLAFFCVIVNTAATLAGSYMLRPIINTFIAPLDGSPGNPSGPVQGLRGPGRHLRGGGLQTTPRPGSG